MELGRKKRGARSNNMIKKSSKPEFVIKAIRSQFPVGAVIYIMTDGSLSYIESILKGLRDYKVFHRDRFPIFKKLWKKNSFKLYVCELIIYYRAKRALQNRKPKSCKRITSLQSLYNQKKLC